MVDRSRTALAQLDPTPAAAVLLGAHSAAPRQIFDDTKVTNHCIGGIAG